MKCIIVEDENFPRMTLVGLLNSYEVTTASTFQEAKELLKSNNFDIAFIDLDLETELAGLKLVKLSKEKGIYTVITTGHIEDELVRKGYELGCKDYLTKPITKKALDLVLKSFDSFESENRIENLIKSKYITKNKRTLDELKIIKKVGLTEKPILIKGPSGTGKRIVGHLIRDALNIPKEKFVEINCAQFTEGLIESEIFGHIKGAFTGANKDKVGLLKQADGGVVFFDEIHSLSRSAQQKLMKAIEEKEFYPVGSSQPIKSQFRVICATCEDLLEMVTENKFRQDFYARISNIQIELFPLRERKEDILPLIHFYIKKYSRKITLTEEAKKELTSLDWQNNTRDIESLVDYWHINHFGVITSQHIPNQYKIIKKEKALISLTKRDIKKIEELGIKDYIDKLKQQIAETFIEMHNGNQSQAAQMLGISKQSISNMLNIQNNHKSYKFASEVAHEQTIQ